MARRVHHPEQRPLQESVKIRTVVRSEVMQDVAILNCQALGFHPCSFV
jgi:hypothetical protein